MDVESLTAGLGLRHSKQYPDTYLNSTVSVRIQVGPLTRVTVTRDGGSCFPKRVFRSRNAEKAIAQAFQHVNQVIKGGADV